MEFKSLNKIIFYIIVLAAFYGSYRVLFFKIDNFSKYATVKGLKQISKTEIKVALDFLNLNNKYFYQINPLEISLNLAKRPVIKKVKIRTTILPQIHYKIYVIEENPWALYHGQIVNQEAEIMIHSSKDAKLYSSEAVKDIYAKSEQLIKIDSFAKLDHNKLLTLKQLTDSIQKSLSRFKADEKLTSIAIDKEENLFFYSKNLAIKFGPFNNKIFDKLAKLELLFDKMKNLSPELEYIDISLGTDEIILGKRQAKIMEDHEEQT